MEGYSHSSSLLQLSLQSLVREGGSASLPPHSFSYLPNNLKDAFRELLLKRRSLTARELECLIHPGVLSVDLSEQVITGGLLKVLMRCRNLRQLDCNQTSRVVRRCPPPEQEETKKEEEDGEVNDLSSHLSQLFTGLPWLTSLHLRDVGGVNAEVMGVLARCCPLLRHLELGGCSAIGDEAVLQLRSLGKLESLSLARTSVSDLGLYTLARCESRDCLVELRVDSCKAITDLGIQALLEGLSGLQILIFHCCPGVTDEVREALDDYFAARGTGTAVRQVTWTIY